MHRMLLTITATRMLTRLLSTSKNNAVHAPQRRMLRNPQDLLLFPWQVAAGADEATENTHRPVFGENSTIKHLRLVLRTRLMLFITTTTGGFPGIRSGPEMSVVHERLQGTPRAEVARKLGTRTTCLKPQDRTEASACWRSFQDDTETPSGAE